MLTMRRDEVDTIRTLRRYYKARKLADATPKHLTTQRLEAAVRRPQPTEKDRSIIRRIAEKAGIRDQSSEATWLLAIELVKEDRRRALNHRAEELV